MVWVCATTRFPVCGNSGWSLWEVKTLPLIIEKGL
jgi:hypothetical protein